MNSGSAQKPKIKAKRRSSAERHYIDDAKFHKALSELQAASADAKEKGLPKPIVSDYIATSLMILARKIARKPGFSRYPFVEDMIGDAIFCCFKNLHNFSPKHPTAFPYFSQIVHYSFIQRILREKTALYRLFRAIIDKQKEMCGVVGAEGSQVYGSRYSDLQMREFCEKFEKRLAEKRLKSRQRKKGAAPKIEFDEEVPTETDLADLEIDLDVDDEKRDGE